MDGAGTPADLLAPAPELQRRLAGRDFLKTAAVLSGLCTELNQHSHQVRLDWAIRLVAARARGRGHLKRLGLAQLLNNDLPGLDVHWREDPPDHPFIDTIPTHRGNFRIFTGGYEKARFCTETLMAAFTATRDVPAEDAISDEVYALLALSDALVTRSGYSVGDLGENLRTQPLNLPTDERLQRLARRVHFTRLELAAIGLSPELLEPFCLGPDDLDACETAEVGDSPLERRPVIRDGDGILVVVPAAISMAVRARIIEAALGAGLGQSLQAFLLMAQGEVVDESGFLSLHDQPLSTLAGQAVRDLLHTISPGRFVHILQTADDFEDWIRRGFSYAPCGEAFSAGVGQSISAARAKAQADPEFRSGCSIWIAGGWGAGRSTPATTLKAHDDWPVLLLEPADAAVFGSTPDASLKDIIRLAGLERAVADQGFELSYADGLLNLFSHWTGTDYALVPPTGADLEPPLCLNFDTGRLAAIRIAAATAIDRRALLHPFRGWIPMTRLDRHEWGDRLDPIYVSIPGLRGGQFIGAAVGEAGTWWVEVDPIGPATMAHSHETWKATLLWSLKIMIDWRARLPEYQGDIRFLLRVASPPQGDWRRLDDEEIDAALRLRFPVGSDIIGLIIGEDWHRGSYRADNRAEIALAAALLEGACRYCDVAMSRKEALLIATDRIASHTFRYKHAFEVSRAIDVLNAQGLVNDVRPLSQSAAALEKCGSVWRVRSRSQSSEVRGKADCVALARALSNREIDDLILSIAKFDRRGLVVAALFSMHAAMASHRQWESTASAMRAIHGTEKDQSISLTQISRANAVLRTSAIIAEMANTCAAEQWGSVVGDLDLEELQSKVVALLYFADMLPSLLGDWQQPVLRISPTGDLRSDHSFSDLTLRSTAERRHAADRLRAETGYADRFDVAERLTDVDDVLGAALKAEYGVPHAVLREFAYAIAELASEDGQGVVVMPRSRLIERLSRVKGLEALDFGPLIDRLTNSPRERWNEIPHGAVAGHFDLSKFDRRLSLIGRPILALSRSVDPDLVLAAGVIERSLVHNMAGAMTGALQNAFWTSSLMKTYASRRGAATGLAFNEEVAATIAGLGLETWPSVKPSWALNHRKTSEVEALGDVDVLVLDRQSNVVWVVEAKDLKLCRTLGEIARRLAEYRGLNDHKNKPDALLRHLRRVDYVRRHASDLVGRLDLAEPPRVYGVLLVRSPQPMNHLMVSDDHDARVVMMDDVENIPWRSGWSVDKK